jgi:hypothetical protein
MKMDPIHLTRAQLEARLSYNRETGEFHWLSSPRSGWVGKRAGSLTNKGYRIIEIDGEPVLTHRLAWFFTYGEWPPHEVDHKNTNRDDNWIDNLRKATKAQNQANAVTRADNSSGIKGIHWSNKANKWVARIQCNNKRYCLGYFEDLDLAAAAYAKASNDHHQEFGRVA